MKEFFIRDDCIQIVIVKKETDVGMLHGENCIQTNHSSYMHYQIISKTDRFVDDILAINFIKYTFEAIHD